MNPVQSTGLIAIPTRLLLYALTGMLIFVQAGDAQIKFDESSNEISQLIQALDSPAYSVRDVATLRLGDIGRNAAPVVFSSMIDPDRSLESKTRCKVIVMRWIEENPDAVFVLQTLARDIDVALIPKPIRLALGRIDDLNESSAMSMLENFGVEVLRKRSPLVVRLPNSFVEKEGCLQLLRLVRSSFDVEIGKKPTRDSDAYCEVPVSVLRNLMAIPGARRISIERRLTDEQFEVLFGDSNLTHLHLPEFLSVSPETFSILGKQQALESLAISVRAMSPEVYKTVGQIQSLRDIDLRWAYNLDEAGINHLAKLKNLESLDFRGTYLTGSDIKPFAEMAKVARFASSHVYMGDGMVETVASFPNLIWLDMANSRLTDDGVKMLPKMPNLQHLDISDCVISDDCLDALVQMQNLLELNVSSTFLSEAGLKRLRDALSETRIVAEYVREVPDVALQTYKSFSKLGAVAGTYNDGSSVTINRTWKGNNEAFLMIDNLQSVVRLGINIPVDDAMAEVLLQIKPVSIHMDESDLKVSKSLREKLKEHHLGLHLNNF